MLAHPDWKAAALATVTRPPERIGIRNYGYLSMVIGLVGTTIAPWMQFYLQASIVEKGVTARQYSASRLDVRLYRLTLHASSSPQAAHHSSSRVWPGDSYGNGRLRAASALPICSRGVSEHDYRR